MLGPPPLVNILETVGMVAVGEDPRAAPAGVGFLVDHLHADPTHLVLPALDANKSSLSFSWAPEQDLMCCDLWAASTGWRPCNPHRSQEPPWRYTQFSPQRHSAAAPRGKAAALLPLPAAPSPSLPWSLSSAGVLQCKRGQKGHSGAAQEQIQWHSPSLLNLLLQMQSLNVLTQPHLYSF